MAAHKSLRIEGDLKPAVQLPSFNRIRGKPLSVRGIQKRIEHYARKGKLQVSCHQLHHTMATQMLNADAALVTIQDLLGHSWIMTTQRYSKVSSVKVQLDYYQAIERIIPRFHGQEVA